METYKEPKLFGKDEDGVYLGKIEEMGVGRYYDVLYISNRKPNLWAFSLFNGYRQLGIFKIQKPHCWHEKEDIIVKKKDDKIVSVESE